MAEDGRQAPSHPATPCATSLVSVDLSAHAGPLSARERPPPPERVLPTSPEVTSRLVSLEDMVAVSLDPLTSNTFESIVVSYLSVHRGHETDEGRSTWTSTN